MRQFTRNFFLNTVGRFRTFGSGIYILNGHMTSATDENDVKNEQINYRNFLTFLSNNCILSSFRDVINLIDHGQELDGGNFNRKPIVCLTYDDAFWDCHKVMAPVLDEFNIKAGFFVNYNLVWGNSEQRNNVLSNMRTNRRPMTSDEILDLSRRGHTIGSHTLDHVNLGSASFDELENQILGNKIFLEEKVGCKIDCFAWPYGGAKHISEEALFIAQKYHRYIFSSIRSKSGLAFQRHVLNRQHVESYWKPEHIKYFMSHDRK